MDPHPPSELKPDSCDAILDTVKTVYNEEIDRFKQVETKTGITLGFVGVILGVFISYVGASKIQLNVVSYVVFSYFFKLTIIGLLTVSSIKLINAIKVGSFQQVDINNIVDAEFAKDNPADVKYSIAATYQETITQNEEKIDKKNDNYSVGLNLMTYGFVLFIIYIILEEIIKNAK
ncbi:MULTISPECIES: hypothetical protein [Paenibacillus]|uniref:hypothetical protein n=1 Tax=Paenibacillus TaxID=44249 RepID=UPI001ABA6ED5|nr:hypothetical protein [Paenibacillus polymyxa]MBO3283085.1 hypothetical protein [Paenibacillus polymyxa]